MADDASGTAQRQPQVTYEKCDLNYFQLVAFQLNVRYAFGVRFAATLQLSCSTVASFWFQTVAQHGAHVQIALARVPESPTTARPVLARQAVRPGTKLHLPPPVVLEWDPKEEHDITDSGSDCLIAVVTSNLYLTNFSNAGHPILTMYQQSNVCKAMVVNLNAALWDATTIHLLIESFAAKIHATVVTTATPKSPRRNVAKFCQLTGWADKLRAPFAEPPSPKYLPMYATIDDCVQGIVDQGPVPATDDTPGILPVAHPVAHANSKEGKEIHQILPKRPGEDDEGTALASRRATCFIPADCVEKCRSRLAHMNVAIQLSHLVMAVFQFALAETYFDQNPHEVRLSLVQSLQLDPRSILVDDHDNSTNTGSPPSHYLHSMGILSHGRRFQTTDFPRVTDTAEWVNWMWTETQRIQKDVQQRIERGEAYMKAMELLTGQIDRTSSLGPVALELIDYGTFVDCLDGLIDVEFGHRFDPCPHMSIVMHVQEQVGCKFEAQLGENQGRAATLRWLGRCQEIFVVLASQS